MVEGNGAIRLRGRGLVGLPDLDRGAIVRARRVARALAAISC
jgi:hypothetical protein